MKQIKNSDFEYFHISSTIIYLYLIRKFSEDIVDETFNSPQKCVILVDFSGFSEYCEDLISVVYSIDYICT